MRTIAVIGKNYGDEGKGLVTASLCSFCVRPLVIKHNGGAQAGHTVENEDKGTRFIHHQIGSGAEYGADTLFAETYHPDLYQLINEVEEFEAVYGFRPKIFAEFQTKITIIDDVLINMALETQRGDLRHGSCGMGINECVERIKAGFEITLEKITNTSYTRLAERLLEIRNEYTLPRIKKLGIDASNPYYSMLTDINVLNNFALSVKKNISLLSLVDANHEWLAGYDTLIFENGQGLLLDEDYLRNAPHLTTSKTGVTEPIRFLGKRDLKLTEAIYVTRSYVTRHGAGPLPNEILRETVPGIGVDMTNEPNEWQGSIRYAAHESGEEFLNPVFEDINGAGIKPSIAITHLNETEGNIVFANGYISLSDFVSLYRDLFEKIYISDNREDIKKIEN